jgi:hypothetical protein
MKIKMVDALLFTILTIGVLLLAFGIPALAMLWWAGIEAIHAYIFN